MGKLTALKVKAPAEPGRYSDGDGPRKDGHFPAMLFTDVPELIVKLRERSSAGRLALEALIFTAARSGEVRDATKSEVDLDNGPWSIPAARMKMGRHHNVPLSPGPHT